MPHRRPALFERGLLGSERRLTLFTEREPLRDLGQRRAARALLGLGCAAAAAPLAVRALTSPRVLSMSPALFSGLLGLTSLVMAKQEREAQRRALEADRGDGAAEPAARSREGKAVSTAEEREGAFGEGR